MKRIDKRTRAYQWRRVPLWARLVCFFTHGPRKYKVEQIAPAMIGEWKCEKCKRRGLICC